MRFKVDNRKSHKVIGGPSMNAQKYQYLNEVDYRRSLLACLMGQGLSEGVAWGKLPPEYPIARATAARDKEAAEKKRWLVTRFAEESFEQPVLDQIREDVHHRPWLDLEAKLRDLSGGVLKSIWVFYSGEEANPDGNQAEWKWQIGNFARNSDWLILKLLLRSKSGVAVGWGKTIATAIDAVADRIRRGAEEVKLNGRKKILITPTVGTPPGASSGDMEHSSTKLAANLSEAINGTWKNVLSLDNVWPVLPAELSGDDKQRERYGFWTSILMPGNYEAIFGLPENYRAILSLPDKAEHKKSLNNAQSNKAKPLIEVVDSLLTSAGAFHVDSYFLKQLRETGGVSIEELTKLAAGDIGSALVPSKETESKPEYNKRLNHILDLITGMRLFHCQDIARRAATNSDPQSPAGVILCALNGNKASIVLDLVRHQAVSTLVVDYHLADSLKSLLVKAKRS
jgi:hypothetical protein